MVEANPESIENMAKYIENEKKKVEKDVAITRFFSQDGGHDF